MPLGYSGARTGSRPPQRAMTWWSQSSVPRRHPPKQPACFLKAHCPGSAAAEPTKAPRPPGATALPRACPRRRPHSRPRSCPPPPRLQPPRCRRQCCRSRVAARARPQQHGCRPTRSIARPAAAARHHVHVRRCSSARASAACARAPPWASRARLHRPRAGRRRGRPRAGRPPGVGETAPSRRSLEAGRRLRRTRSRHRPVRAQRLGRQDRAAARRTSASRLRARRRTSRGRPCSRSVCAPPSRRVATRCPSLCA
mmetsp:Transcript_14565/g.33937  ORF Transcript_14565/g.33937 Transcript_14565/m.33937 type:complete len:255 (-) Transcript_14565:380-1144(-)